MSDNRPIGVFDSGIGGLTVLHALHDALPLESTIYLGDLARCPYGTRQQSQVRDFAVQVGDLLAERNIKLLVVACNTATAAAISTLVDRYPFPVIGVIEPGAAAAALASRTGRIGVMATDGTVASGAYPRAIRLIRPEATVVQCSGSWLVPLIERGTLARPRVAAGLAASLATLHSENIDTLILGCTHFPLVRDLFLEQIGPGIVLLDSAATLVTRVSVVLDSLDLAASGTPAHQFLVTGPAEAFAERAQAMFRASPTIHTVELVGSAL